MTLRTAQKPAAGRFAHLVNRITGKPRAEEAPMDETEEDKAARLKAEEGDKPEEEPKDKPPADAEGMPAEDDEEDEDMAKAVKAATVAERARCAAIFADPAAGMNAALAATLAFETGLSAGEAVKVLRAGGAAAGRPGLGARMDGSNQPKIAADVPPKDPKAGHVDFMAAAMAKAGGAYVAPKNAR